MSEETPGNGAGIPDDWVLVEVFDARFHPDQPDRTSGARRHWIERQRKTGMIDDADLRRIGRRTWITGEGIARFLERTRLRVLGDIDGSAAD